MTFPENHHPLSEYAARGIGRAYPRTEKQFTHVATFCLTHLNPSVFVITATSIGPPTDSSEEVICRFLLPFSIGGYSSPSVPHSLREGHVIAAMTPVGLAMSKSLYNVS